ncbi:MAG: hypothetical protein AAB401_17725, partial [Acidobacteriota bacterium]
LGLLAKMTEKLMFSVRREFLFEEFHSDNAKWLGYFTQLKSFRLSGKFKSVESVSGVAYFVGRKRFRNDLLCQLPKRTPTKIATS